MVYLDNLKRAAAEIFALSDPWAIGDRIANNIKDSHQY